jgi:hypothetical protein
MRRFHDFWDGFEPVTGYISSLYHGLDCFIRQAYGNAAVYGTATSSWATELASVFKWR